MNLQGLLELIRCPKCKSTLIHDGDWLVSSDPTCRLKYEIKQEIPVLIPEEAVAMSVEEWGNVMAQHGRDRISGQAS